LKGDGFPGPQAANSMAGTIAGTIEGGSLRQTPALKQLRSLLGAEAPTDIPFEVIKHAARIDAGKLLLDKVNGDLGKDLFAVSGALGFDQSLDLDVMLKLASSRVEGGGFIAQMARYGKDADGRIPIEVKITGTALAPRVIVKPGKLIQAAGGEMLKEQLTKLVGGGRKDSAGADSVKPKSAVDALKSMFEKKKVTKPPPAAPDTTHTASRDSTAKRDSTTNPVNRALERLLGK